MRHFEGGATRDDDTGKLDFEGYLSPVVLQRYAEYMLKHQHTADGMRGSDNWQSGMDRDVYMKSLLRHVHDVWLEHRGYESRDGLEEALCAVLFNAMGYLFETLHDESTEPVDELRACSTCGRDYLSFEECAKLDCCRTHRASEMAAHPDRWEPKPVAPHVENPEDELVVRLTFDSWCSTCKYLTGGPTCLGCWRDERNPFIAPTHWLPEGEH